MSVVMDKYETMDGDTNLKHFSATFGVSQVFGGLAVVLVAFWMGSDGGYGWSESPKQQFHYHPLFMVIGMVFLYGEAILVYRVFRHEKKRFTKLLHVVMHSMTLVFVIVALKAVFDSHNYNKDDEGNLAPILNLYSLHSWIGILLLAAFITQYVFGFVTFFYPTMSQPTRQWLLPKHQLIGIVLFVISVGTALMGIVERSSFKAHFPKCVSQKKEMCGDVYMVNFLGLSIVGYAGTVLYLVINPAFKRRPLPEEESLHQLTND